MIDRAPDRRGEEGNERDDGERRSRLEDVKAEFAAFLAGRTESPGAQLAAYVYGRRAVDPRGGDDITR